MNIQSCKLIPSVKNKNGEFVDSKLFKDLLSFTKNNRSLTIRLYKTIISARFKSDFFNKIDIDDNNEPTLSSVLKNVDTSILAKDIEITSTIDKKAGGIDNDGNRILKENTIDNYKSMYEAAKKANDESLVKDKFVTIVNTDENGMLYIETIAIDKLSDKIQKASTYNYMLIEKLESLFDEFGIDRGILYETYKEISDFSAIKDNNVAERLLNSIMAIAQKSKGNLFSTGGNNKAASLFVLNHLKTKGVDIINRFESTVMADSNLQKALLGDNAYEQLSKVYDNERLGKEALLVGLFALINEDISPSSTGYSSMISSLLKTIRDTYSGVNINSIINAFNEVDSKLNDFETHQNINFGYADILIKNNAVNAKQSERAKVKAISIRKLLEKMISLDIKQYELYSHRLDKSKSGSKYAEGLEKWQKEHKEQLNEIKIKLAKEEYADGIVSFMQNMLNDLSIITSKKIPEVIDASLPISSKAFKLGNIINYIKKYDSIAEELSKYDMFFDDDEINNKIISLIKQANDLVNNIKLNVKRESINTFGSFLSAFLSEDGISITSGKQARKITKEDIPILLETAEEDMSLINTWLVSPSHARNVIIKLSDQAMKDCKERKRQRVLSIQKQISAKFEALKKSGIKNTDFIFEKHQNGELSIRYKSDINWTKFFDDKESFMNYLREKYGDNPRGDEYKAMQKEKAAWFKEYTDEYGNPKISKYKTDFKAGWTNEQIEYYDTFMSIRNSLIDMIPSSIYKEDPMLAIQVTKDTWERIKSSSIDVMGKQLIEAAKDQLITKVDDTNYGTKSGLSDFAGKEVMTIPIFFTKKVKNESDLSRDCTSTLLAFADSCINYDEMSNVVDVFEIGKEVMEDAVANVKRGDKQVTEKKTILGQVIQSPIKENAKRSLDAYNNLLETQLYHRYMKQDNMVTGKNFEIKYTKAAQLLNRFTALNTLALNGLAAIAAVGNDMLNIESEALAQEFFTNKDLKMADKAYFKDLPTLMGELGNPIKTSKLGLFLEQFDVLHEYEHNILDMGFDTSKIKKALSENSLYFLMTAGSHWGEARTAIAQAMNSKIKSDDGTTEKSLWDILTVKYVDESDKSLGATLVVEDGFTLTTEDISKYTNSFIGLNVRLFGAYNQANKTALERTAAGSLVFLFRKFLIPGINRRFAKADYNMDLDKETEGYYRSFGTFLKNLLDDSDGLRFHILAKYEQLTPTQQKNVIRACNELGMLMVLTVFSMILSGSGWSEKDRNWAERFVAYMTTRMKTEAAALTPFGVLGETWNIIKSPAASVNTLETFGSFMKVFNPYNYEGVGGEDALVKSGRYKGHNKAYKYAMNMVPMNRTVYKFFHPEEAAIAFR